MQYYEALGLEPKLALDPDDLQEAFLRAQPGVASRPLQPRHAGATPASTRYDGRHQRRLSNPARSCRARRILPEANAAFELSKEVPPELLEEVFELNMALEEMRGGDDSARPQLDSARERFAADAGGDRRGLERSSSRGYDSAPGNAVLDEIPRQPEPPALHLQPAARCRQGIECPHFKLILAIAEIENRRHRPGHHQQPGRGDGADRAAHSFRHRTQRGFGDGIG